MVFSFTLGFDNISTFGKVAAFKMSLGIGGCGGDRCRSTGAISCFCLHRTDDHLQCESGAEIRRTLRDEKRDFVQSWEEASKFTPEMYGADEAIFEKVENVNSERVVLAMNTNNWMELAHQHLIGRCWRRWLSIRRGLSTSLRPITF